MVLVIVVGEGEEPGNEGWRKNNVNMTEHIIAPQAKDELALVTRIQNAPLP